MTNSTPLTTGQFAQTSYVITLPLDCALLTPHEEHTRSAAFRPEYVGAGVGPVVSARGGAACLSLPEVTATGLSSLRRLKS